MKNANRVRWSDYTTLGAVDSIVTVSGVLSGITFESSANKSIIISGALAAGFATAIALFFAVYLNAKRESRSEYPFPVFPRPGMALVKGMGTAVTTIAVSTFVVSPFFILTISDAFLVSVAISLSSLFALGWLRAEGSVIRRRLRLRAAVEMISLGMVAMVTARLVAVLIALAILA